MNKIIYFIKPVGMDGPIKVGLTSSIDRRFDDFMKWSPIALEVITFCAGNYNIECRIHRMLIDSHSHKEWFHPTPELHALIASVENGTFDPDSLPDDARPLWYEWHCEKSRQRAKAGSFKGIRGAPEGHWPGSVPASARPSASSSTSLPKRSTASGNGSGEKRAAA